MTEEENMAAKVNRSQISEVAEALRLSADGDGEAAQEARRLARRASPLCIEFLSFVVTDDAFASPTQRVRSAGMLLECAELLKGETKSTGLFAEDADGTDRRAKS
ncbi:MAG: hypothetical protein JOY90_22375 [Bradyrhizobium sp.]|uniref:hypothetical protein n=1 Tax=Bradyrhizobium sp. TaxID=376 RepID=UPI001D904816|nr:hypothetical protein [Bradyrhizobium sp.]MBV9563164.1 hypothetical protein [Bradyrhizobium sp.]